MAKYCCICKRPLENPEAPVLTMGAYGSPKCVCDNCSEIIETATSSHEYEEITSACRELGDALTKGDTGDMGVIQAVNDILSSAKERADAIKEGTYDFSLDSINEDTFEITEDLEETEEDKAKDEKEAKTIKVIDTVVSWTCGAALVAALVFFIIKFVL